jgi:hypothetical protein
MQVEQKNLWENVTRNVNVDNSSKAIAAYQANMPSESSNLFGVNQEYFEKSFGVSANGSIDMATYDNPMKPDQKETVAEQYNKKDQLEADNRKNEMVVLSNTTSAEDYKKLSEDGFSLADTDSYTIITVTDKIKATLAEAGVDISGYGDGLSREQLEEITGSTVVADQVIRMLTANDLPVTDANLEGSVDALSQVASMSEISEPAMAYLLKNDLEPSIQNLYVAQHSSSVEGTVSVEDAALDFDALTAQMVEIIESAGLEVDDTSIANSKWLVVNDIPLTEENLLYLADLQDLSGQMKADDLDWNQIMNSMAKAITDGKRPQDASLITARRQLEETRLAMTSDASVSMLKRGVEIDTQPLEKLVEELKAQEKEYYSALLDGVGIDPTDDHVNVMSQTIDFLEEMKGQPSYVLGQIDRTDSLETIHDTGAKLQQELAKASADYETLMTAPRKDMGDSIQKAFSNVDDILNDMGMENSEGNRRAVRILAYNQTPITEENVLDVKSLDEQMQRTFRNMNPAVTLEMIRRGENPLDMNMEQLNQAAEEIKQEIGNEEQERFNKYLWKLEQNHEISQEERSSYIGIYRLIAQVEKTDGAAIGFLRKEGADLTMRNLLSAVRTQKKGEMDYTVSDEFAGVEGKTEGPKIDDQIEVGFQQNCLKDVLEGVSPEKLERIGKDIWGEMTPEQFAEALAQIEESEQEKEASYSYIQEQLAMYQQVLDVPEDVYSYLEHYDMANTMANILAVHDMLRSPNQTMERLFRNERFSQSSLEKIAALKQQVFDDFAEALKNPSELADAQETLAEVAEHVMDTMIIEEPNVSTSEIRDIRQVVTQLGLCGKRTEEECYMIPIPTGDSVTGVSLKVVRGKKEKGIVDILFDCGKMGKVAASFHAKEEGISGMIAVDREETRQFLNDHQEELAARIRGDAADTQNAENVQEAATIQNVANMQNTANLQNVTNTQQAVELHIAYVPDLSLSHYELSGIQRQERMQQNGQLAEDSSNSVQTRRLYQIAEGFIQSISEYLS